MKKSLLLAVACLFVGNLAQAHETFVMPVNNKEYRSGDTVTLALLITHLYTVGDVIPTAEASRVSIVKNGSRGSPLPLTVNENRRWVEATYTLTDNTPVIVEGNRTGRFTCTMTDGTSIIGTRAAVAAANPGRTIASVEYSERFSKAYLNPVTNDNSFSVPLGHDLEIIPLTNPAGIRSGSNSRVNFRVLYKGQPLANTEVKATWDTYDYKNSDNFAQTGTTNARGEITFRITNPGLWLLRAGDIRPSSRPQTIGITGQQRLLLNPGIIKPY